MLSRISLGLDRLSGDSSKGAFKNQFGSGSTFRVILKGAFKNQFGSGSNFG